MKWSDELAHQIQALPFVDRVPYGRVYFKPITWAEYTVKDVYFDWWDMDICQDSDCFEDAPHPHIVEEDEEWDDDEETYTITYSFCGNKSEIRSLMREGQFVEAVTEAFLVASTYTFWDAPNFHPSASYCCHCGEVGSYATLGERIGFIITYPEPLGYQVVKPIHRKCRDILDAQQKDHKE
jgi:hypothetical protein